MSTRRDCLSFLVLNTMPILCVAVIPKQGKEEKKADRSIVLRHILLPALSSLSNLTQSHHPLSCKTLVVMGNSKGEDALGLRWDWSVIHGWWWWCYSCQISSTDNAVFSKWWESTCPTDLQGMHVISVYVDGGWSWWWFRRSHIKAAAAQSEEAEWWDHCCLLLFQSTIYTMSDDEGFAGDLFGVKQNGTKAWTWITQSRRLKKNKSWHLSQQPRSIPVAMNVSRITSIRPRD